MIGIYCIANTENGKMYIGQSLNIETRLYEHKRHLMNGEHINKHLQYSWDKYGGGHFIFGVLEICSPENLDSEEIRFIELYSTMNDKFGYNKKLGGRGGHLGEEHKKHISESCRKLTQEQARQIYAMKGKIGQAQISRQFHISQGTVVHIWQKKSYADIH